MESKGDLTCDQRFFYVGENFFDSLVAVKNGMSVTTVMGA